MYRICVELSAEIVSVFLQSLSFHIEFPALPQYIFHSLEIRVQLSFQLSGPDDGSRNRRKIAKLAHVKRFRSVVTLFELFVQRRDVLFYTLNQLRLVLVNGSFDLP